MDINSLQVFNLENYTSNNTRQHVGTRVQHEATRVQNETIWDNRNTTGDNTSTMLHSTSITRPNISTKETLAAKI